MRTQSSAGSRYVDLARPAAPRRPPIPSLLVRRLRRRLEEEANARAANELARLMRLEATLRARQRECEEAIAACDERLAGIRGAEPPGYHPASALSGRSRTLSLRATSFDDLRRLGMSVTQARRVIRYRDAGVLASPGGLESVPGLPQEIRTRLRTAMTD